MRYLITGGAGFIGAHLAEALIADGHQVTVIDDLSTGQRANLANIEAHPNLELIIANILDYPELDSLVENADIIFHLAAAVGVELVVHDPVKTITTNVHGTEKILLPAAKYHKRIIVASTSEVYGKSDKQHFNELDDLLIGSPYHSRWAYACSKLIDEFFVMASDGLWDYYTPDSSVVTDARRALRANRGDAQACSEWLLGQALLRQRAVLHPGTPGDKITIAVVTLRPLPQLPRHSRSRLNLRAVGPGDGA